MTEECHYMKNVSGWVVEPTQPEKSLELRKRKDF